MLFIILFEFAIGERNVRTKKKNTLCTGWGYVQSLRTPLLCTRIFQNSEIDFCSGRLHHSNMLNKQFRAATNTYLEFEITSLLDYSKGSLKSDSIQLGQQTHKNTMLRVENCVGFFTLGTFRPFI